MAYGLLPYGLLGGSVSFESTPSCRDPADPWYISYGEYNTANHFSYFDGDLMQSYIRKTGSIVILAFVSFSTRVHARKHCTFAVI